MMKYLLARLPALLLASIVGLIVSSSAFGQATIVIENGDTPGSGTGFYDTTPATPVGGNTGTTVGEQRLIAFQAAANIWGATLTSGPTIVIRASWSSTMPCGTTSGTLASSGTTSLRANFANAPFNSFWYGVALANALAGSDPNPANAEINATFNLNVGTSGCLTNTTWYYGLDNNHGPNGTDLFAVCLHEFAHGLGFASFTNAETGVLPGTAPNIFPGIYEKFLLDNTTGKTWPDMTDAERVASALNTRRLAWNGPQVTSDVPSVLGLGTPLFRVNSPPALAVIYQIGTATFGPPLSSPGVTGDLAQAIPTDGCSAIGGAVSGKTALIDRGTCTFVTKVKNAQNAGATGVVIVNNVAGSPPPGMPGTDFTITIPSLMITQSDGDNIKAQLGFPVNATLTQDPAVRTGADPSGRALLFTPNPVSGGSSVSHWDASALPNQLMEPGINNDLTHSVTTPQDLTLSLLKDIGWSTGPPPPPPSPPANDNFANAQLIGGCSGSVTGTNAGGTHEPGEPSHDSATPPDLGAASVWYQWQAPGTGSVTITTAGSNYDTMLGVYTGTSVSTLTTIAKNDDVDPGIVRTSTVTFDPIAGTIYRIAVDGWGGETGSITLNWTESNCWQPTTLTSGQVEIKTWIFEGKTSAYVKLLFPDAGYRVADWGTPVRVSNDFSVDAVVEKFNGASVQALKTTAQIYDLGVLIPDNYNFIFKNSGTTVKSQAFTVGGPVVPNPIDGAREFVRWQYKDFLSREPDIPGWDHWEGEITMCSDPAQRNPGETEPQCVERKRANTSAAFFLSPEFQNTGYFVLRVYRGSLGRMPFFGGSGDNAKDEFTRDAATVAAGIVVNDSLSPAIINSNKQAFVNQFVTRADFLAIYGGLNNTEYVNKLFQTTGITPTSTERQDLIDQLDAGAANARASVLFKIVDGTNTITDGALQFLTPYGHAFYDQQFNPGFVQMEYFGYMKRDPDDGGYAFWLGKLNSFGNWVDAQMVLAFINSPEYRARFGQP